MGRIFLAELMKLRKSSIWLLIFVCPLLSMAVGFLKGNFQFRNLLFVLTIR